MKTHRILAFLFPVLLLAACGGGSDSDGDGGSTPPPVVDAKPGGYYTGTVTQDGESFSIEGLISEDGHAVLFSEYGIYVAQFSMDGREFDDVFTAYAFLGETWDGENSVLEGNIQGEVVERRSISADFTLGGQLGSVALLYQDDVYEQAATANRIVGDWGYTLPDAGYSINITFSSNGTFFGQDNEGCTYAGEWDIPDEDYNAYEFSKTTISCESGGGEWSGLALISFESGVNDDVMLFGIHNEELAYADLLIRQ